jgi:hypothetical protein
MLRWREFLSAGFEGEHVKAVSVSMATNMLTIKLFVILIIVLEYYKRMLSSSEMYA